ncbi:hypothetical protein QAD02_021867 [Eretmocerus hayati]|uniref:Uncharacterized protein n=1 Tax=Eretmocerus hayati TaxID=131215 RepID=A0ACC2PSI6_9HYME|nr:hypothetical protein QAD02_021867 [Eretmocerus hayati]
MQPFSHLETEHKRIKIMKERGLIMPEPYILGSETQIKYQNGQIIKEIINVVAHWVPLRKTFQAFFQLPGVLGATLEYMQELYADHSILRNLIQAELWMEKINRYYQGKIVIPFVIYSDPFEINDCLGSHRGISKLEGVYCSIPCLPPEFRSAIQNIFLVLLYYAADRKRFSNEDIFTQLIDEINYLEEVGLEFDINGNVYTIYFALAQLIGDHLGLNALMDMVESFNDCYFCRTCITHPYNAKTDLRERKSDLRHVEDYSKHVELGYKSTGLRRNSVWNKVKYYHVYLNSYSDVLHDIPEGFLSYGIPQVLHHFVFKAKKKVDLGILNDRLNTFNYTINGLSNKPPPITVEELRRKTTSFSASERLTFTLILPMLIGDLIDFGDEVWQYYLSMRRIVDITYAKQLQGETCDLLDTEVEEHNEMFQRLFNATLKAKHHAGTHFGRHIRKVGPLANLSTDRFESKNKTFKVSAESTTSRKQPTFTLSFKNQCSSFNRMSKKQGFVPKFETGPKYSLSERLIRNVSEISGVVLQNLGSNETSWINVNGIRYNVGGCIVISTKTEDMPCFGIIDHIIVNNDGHRASFCCTNLYTNFFDENLHAFNVSSSNETVYIPDTEKLESIVPVIIHCMPNGQIYVTLKRSL